MVVVTALIVRLWTLARCCFRQLPRQLTLLPLAWHRELTHTSAPFTHSACSEASWSFPTPLEVLLFQWTNSVCSPPTLEWLESWASSVQCYSTLSGALARPN